MAPLVRKREKIVTISGTMTGQLVDLSVKLRLGVLFCASATRSFSRVSFINYLMICTWGLRMKRPGR
ncbi:hypothetical protein [uncultured Tateyamaria sp.]|uniref:hypothetical protein n=1 Tax=uncultured Tateyamaria sp. TaxID=455651 RepID=UPI00262A25DB|nr:hypothetical protein [uncultured Tateyamaria sp.]